MTDGQALLSPKNAAKALDIGLTTLYRMMKDGTIKWVPFGSDRRIPTEEINRLSREGTTAKAA